ncbi:MAG: hypothetical protein P4N60_06960 [Verrucomicrobiae bacterium]|nr:hypothetical protein [Verrucomicrobiae bacterium]
MSPDELPIVLTATIIPNVTGAASTDPAIRLGEYRHVLQFCQQFAPVIFLENSGYPLERHPEFADSIRLRVHRFAPSTSPERGKGFQEFEMIDAWLAREPHPPARWLKLTGRYQLLNLDALLAECRREKKYALLIDQLAKQRFARTHLFYVTTAFYQERMKNLYQQCNDDRGEFIEHVLFRALGKISPGQVRIFKTQPDFLARLGSTGNVLPSGSLQWFAKQCLRRVNHLVDERRLLYVR